jgi:caa(3)-type oxidase subunit IV
MSAQTMSTKVCLQCGHKNPYEAKFCNNCAFRFREDLMSRPAAAPAHGAVAHGAPAHAAHGAGEAHAATHSGSHHSQMFYLGVFAALAVITLIELVFTGLDNQVIKLGALIILSIAKFCLVVMFFMHLKGDKKIYSLLFIGPLFIGAGVLLTLIALFSNFTLR